MKGKTINPPKKVEHADTPIVRQVSTKVASADATCYMRIPSPPNGTSSFNYELRPPPSSPPRQNPRNKRYHRHIQTAITGTQL